MTSSAVALTKLETVSERQSTYDRIKRVSDVLGAVVLLVIFSPFIALAALINYCFYGAPVIYRQARLTAGRKVFTIYKFRTMTLDAEAGTGAVWASKRDPRVTPFGRIMRFTRIDELPQLFNVLNGDMSLIGPRPERPELAEELVKQYPSFYKRLDVKAGLTGLAQVEAGYTASVETYRRKLALDLLYIKKKSVFFDFLIAVRTVVVMLTGRGAH